MRSSVRIARGIGRGLTSADATTSSSRRENRRSHPRMQGPAHLRCSQDGRNPAIHDWGERRGIRLPFFNGVKGGWARSSTSARPTRFGRQHGSSGNAHVGAAFVGDDRCRQVRSTAETMSVREIQGGSGRAISPSRSVTPGGSTRAAAWGDGWGGRRAKEVLVCRYRARRQAPCAKKIPPAGAPAPTAAHHRETSRRSRVFRPAP